MASISRSSVSAAILQAYYTRVTTLAEYLSELLDAPLCVGPQEEDGQEYHDLVKTMLVGTKMEAIQDKISVQPPIASMSQTILRAQTQLLSPTTSKGSYSKSILTQGCRMEAGSATRFTTNTIVLALEGPEWVTLLERIGTDAMLHLLTATDLFLALPNGCFCQMTGFPLMSARRIVNQSAIPEKDAKSSQKRKSTEQDNPSRSSKERKLAAGQTVSAKRMPEQLTAIDVSLSRLRIFYSKPAYMPNSHVMAVGLSKHHVLSLLWEKHHQLGSEGQLEPIDVSTQMQNALHLAKYVFPRQYGLSTPFAAPSIGLKKIRSFEDREQEIKTLGHCKTPKRIKESIPLLEMLIWRHGKCRYKYLRDMACPSKLKKDDHILDQSVIFDMLSEPSIQPQSQMSFGDTSVDATGHAILPAGRTQAKQHIETKPRFAEFMCTRYEVTRYLILVTKAVIPKRFWGSEANFRLICKHFQTIIGCRRHESISIHQLIQGFSTSMCDWLMPPGSGAGQHRVTVSDALKRKELLEDFLHWFFESFILSVLKTTFYITDSSAYRMQVLYFRQDDWQKLCAPLLKHLTTKTYQKLETEEAENMLRHRKLGFSFVRLLPKETGVRPIVNLSKKNAGNRPSVNQILQTAFSILSYEKRTNPGLVGASIFGTDDVYQKLLNYKVGLPRSREKSLPKMYFVKVDVQACFDTIEQGKLISIIRELIAHDKYVIQRFGKVVSGLDRVQTRYIRNAVPEGEDMHFVKYAKDLANFMRDAIFVDQAIYPSEDKAALLLLLEQHITDNLIGKDFYRQIVGIPQGSVISTLLCAYFYGDLDKRFGHFTDDTSSSVMLRQVDDYLYITTDLTKAKSFLRTMIAGHPEYGCFISKDKTVTNFDCDDAQLNVLDPGVQVMAWCGYNIDLRDLSVSVDYSRLGATRLRNTLTVDHRRNFGKSFRRKMLYFAKQRNHMIFTDSVLNSDRIVHLNIYQNFLVAAMKMQAYLRSANIDARKNSSFLYNTIQEMCLYHFSSTMARQSSKRAKLARGHVSIHRVDVAWLGSHAFHRILSRTPREYTRVIQRLSDDLRRTRFRRCSRRFQAIVRDGLSALTDIKL